MEEVVKLLERDGKSTEAGKVKEILAKNKGIEAQGRALKQLDWYPTVIVPYLDELRVVNYNCLYEIYREPNDEEVMAQYREKGLKGSYTRYEYWKLFQLITDEKELEALYRRAYEEYWNKSIRGHLPATTWRLLTWRGIPWILPYWNR